MTIEQQLLDSWKRSNRINLYLLEILAPHMLELGSQGGAVGEQFAELHNVRLTWLSTVAPELLDGLERLERGETLSRERLIFSLKRSSEAVSRLLELGLEAETLEGFKPHVATFHSYIVAHEAHHRGRILLTLKRAGYRIDRKIPFNLWDADMGNG